MFNKSVSEEINVEVVTRFQPEYSKPKENQYLFAYQITITNHNSFPVQLLSRKWMIKEASGKQTIVNGEGVVGKMPILQPGESFQYVSCCPLESPIGTMEGHYKFINLDNEEQFISLIPKFSLLYPYVLN